MADGLEPTETLTSFEKYNELGVNDDDAGDEYNAANFRSAPNWNELRKGADLVLLLVIDQHKIVMSMMIATQKMIR